MVLHLLKFIYYVSKTIILIAIMVVQEVLGLIMLFKPYDRVSSVPKDPLKATETVRRYEEDELFEITLEDFN